MINNYSSAPVCLFVYKRHDTLKHTIASLLENELAPFTDIHIFSDAAACDADIENVNAVRNYIRALKGFKSVFVYLSEKNNGLAQSIIDGVSKIVNTAGRVIVLEDDLIVSRNFLNFMNEALTAYENNLKIFSVSGYSSPVKVQFACDVYYTRRASSWGWATWKNRWEEIDWTVPDFEQFSKDREKQNKFNKMGSDLTHMLKKQMNGRINSWAIRWVYHQFKYDLLTVFPLVSKVSNNGFHKDATHTAKNDESRFSTYLDESNQTNFNFSPRPYLDKNILKQFVAPYTIKTRVLYKIKSLLHL
ncbi:MAG: sugar transferase [Ferruginibacter sp.]